GSCHGMSLPSSPCRAAGGSRTWVARGAMARFLGSIRSQARRGAFVTPPAPDPPARAQERPLRPRIPRRPQAVLPGRVQAGGLVHPVHDVTGVGDAGEDEVVVVG